MGCVMDSVLDLFYLEFKGLVWVPWLVHAFVVSDEVSRGFFCVGLVEVVEEVKDRVVCVTKVRLFNGGKVDVVNMPEFFS